MSLISTMLNQAQRESSRMLTGGWEFRRIRIQRFYLPRTLSALSLPLRLVLAALLIALLTALKPFVRIRFARLSASTLGTWLLQTELYLCEVDEGMHPKRTLDIFYHYWKTTWRNSLIKPIKAKDAICNKQLDKMFKRTLRVLDLVGALDNLVRMLPRAGSDFVMLDVLPGSRRVQKGNEYLSRQEDLHGLLDRWPAHLKFTTQEEKQAKIRLNEMGIAPDSPYVCFAARDGEWGSTAYPRQVSVYGEYNRDDRRNASIHNYVLAAEKLVELGYYAVRLGQYVPESLNTDNPRIIDYSTKFHSDLMDPYLSANCAFFIGQNSGMTSLPLIFRTPIAFVNIYPLRYINYCANEPNIFIPKHFHSDEKGRLLTFREQLDLGFARLNVIDDPNTEETIRRLGLRILENTPDEIADVALEMHQRLRSEFEESSEAEQLHGQFLNIIRSYPKEVYFDPSRYEHLKIASCFLKRHPESVG